MSGETSFPFLTAALPGLGGVVKELPEDFVVEELPVYRPSGSGEHLFLWVEKTDVSGPDLVRHIGRALGISPRDIGMAGVKDRRAVTRQFVSVPARAEERIGRIETDRIRVLSSARHGNKLRTGHLAGNRFSILVRGVDADAAERARPIAETVNQHGFPNYYGEQRFGRDNETLELGLALLGGQKRPHEIPAPRRTFLLRMALSAVQSALFNDVLAERLRDGALQHGVARRRDASRSQRRPVRRQRRDGRAATVRRTRDGALRSDVRPADEIARWRAGRPRGAGADGLGTRAGCFFALPQTDGRHTSAARRLAGRPPRGERTRRAAVRVLAAQRSLRHDAVREFLKTARRGEGASGQAASLFQENAFPRQPAFGAFAINDNSMHVWVKRGESFRKRIFLWCRALFYAAEKPEK